MKETEFCTFYDEKIILHTKHRYITDSSPINYRIIFWGSSTNMHNVFLIQKIIKTNKLGLGPRSSSRGEFKKLDIQTVPSFYIFALMMFVLRNPDNFHINALIQSTEMQQKKINYIYHQ